MPPFSPSFPLRRLLLAAAAAVSLLYLLLSSSTLLSSTSLSAHPPPLPPPPPPTALWHIIFGIASSSKSLPRRLPYLRLWFRPALTRALVFLDSSLPAPLLSDPPTAVSIDASRFPYSFPGGLRSAIRVSRIVKELLERFPHDGVRWVVLGDDDTVFFPENLVGTLAKYDWTQWYYVGASSESVGQNVKHSFGMAFGGGGVAISYPLARVLARVLDACLMRYAHLYGSDARIYACLAELGVELTHESGFHQVDLRGDLFGLLSAHPLTPLVSLHHVDHVDPIFPGMNRSEALKHLFEAVNVDPVRILQQTVCYDQLNVRTISVSWGYAVQVFEGNHLLPDLLASQQTFIPWKRSRDASSSLYMFNTREVSRDPCKRPSIFFFESISSNSGSIESKYSRYPTGSCPHPVRSNEKLQWIRATSPKLNTKIGQVMRRHCCDVLPSTDEIMDIKIRKCADDELIAMTS